MRKLVFVLIISVNIAVYGQFAPPAGQTGTTAIRNSSKYIIGWATSCEVARGWMNVADTTLGKATFGEPNDAVGVSNPQVVSLGDGGVATLSFDEPIQNNEGADFAVFENGFDDSFLELAHVEVSSDGLNFVRFSSISNTQKNTQVGPFGTLDAAKIHNLAGKYRAQYGTPFDLEELKDSSNLNVDSIVYVRIIDVVGSVNSDFGSYDSEGNLINDPYPTDFENGGFDLDAVAVLDMTIEVNSISENYTFIICPNPVKEGDLVKVKGDGFLMNSLGQIVKSSKNKILNTSGLNSGYYFYKTESSEIHKLLIQ